MFIIYYYSTLNPVLRCGSFPTGALIGICTLHVESCSHTKLSDALIPCITALVSVQGLFHQLEQISIAWDMLQIESIHETRSALQFITTEREVHRLLELPSPVAHTILAAS